MRPNRQNPHKPEAQATGRASPRLRFGLVWLRFYPPALLALVSLLALVPAARCQPADNSLPVPEARIEQRLGEQVPLDLVFRDESGKAAPLRRYFDGKPVVLILAYFQCRRQCPVVLEEVMKSLRDVKDYQIGKEFNVLTVSFDPRDGPDEAAARKALYADGYGRPGARRGWHFLTGQEAHIKRLARAVGFGYSYDAKGGQYAHANGIMILTADGKVSRYFYGLDYPPRDLRFGLEDASAGTVGSPVAVPLRQLCFGYDPATGKYGLMTMRLVRLGGLLTVLVLGSALWFFWRRERRRAAACGLAVPPPAKPQAAPPPAQP